MLDDPSVEAVILCLPHDLHKLFSIDALAASKHVLVEKPMALSEEEAVEMVPRPTSQGIFFQLGNPQGSCQRNRRPKHCWMRVGPVKW